MSSAGENLDQMLESSRNMQGQVRDTLGETGMMVVKGLRWVLVLMLIVVSIMYLVEEEYCEVKTWMILSSSVVLGALMWFGC